MEAATCSSRDGATASRAVPGLRGRSLRWRIHVTGAVIIAIFTVIIFTLLIPHFERERIQDREGKLKAVVALAASLVDFHAKSVRKRAWSPAPSMPRTVQEAKASVIRDLREARYDKTEVLFILDGEGNMVMHPLKPELEGKNLMEVTDPAGVRVFRDLVINAQRDGEAVVRYSWQSKYSPVILEPQMTYARYDWEWDWVICSSLYTQDINDAVATIRVRSALYVLLTALAAGALLIVIIHVGVSKPLDRLKSGILELHEGNLDYRITVRSEDEIGYISKEFNLMVAALKESRDSIVKSEAKYRDLTNLLPDVIYEADADLRLTYLNDAGFALSGYSREDFARGLGVRDLVGPGDFARLAATMKDRDNPRFVALHKVLKKGGGSFYGENSATAVFDGDRVVALLGSIRDVTDKQRFEEHLLQTQKMETIGTLAGGLAHDFNNVLGGIIGTLSVLRFELEEEQTLDVPALRDHLDLMEKAAQRAANMVKQLLTLSRKRETEFAIIDLNVTIANVKKICETTFDKSIELRVAVPPGPSSAFADPTQMEQVLLNLCINASHAMTLMRPEGATKGGVLEVGMEMVRADRHFCSSRPEAREIDYWRVSVGDTGVGMDQSTIAKIFVPFFTTKDKDKGTGLGLSMVYNIVHQHSGFINVQSEVGVGSTFQVFIPVLRAAAAAERRSVDEQLPAGAGLVLVVDDEETMRRLAETILGKCGYRTVSASDGAEGVRLFRERSSEFVGVLLDLVMPKKSGEQAFREIREVAPEVKVILTSGFKQDERVDVAMRQGIDAFVQKPYTLRTLAEAATKVFGKA